jgi:hypothetical protein
MICVKILLEGIELFPETIGIITFILAPPRMGACSMYITPFGGFPLNKKYTFVDILTAETLYLFPLYVTGGTLLSSYDNTIPLPTLFATQVLFEY